VEIIKGELADARKRGDADAVTALEQELVNAAKTGKVAGKYPDAAKTVPPSAGPQVFERDASGKIVPKGTKAAAAPTTVSTPAAGPALPPEVEGVGQQLEAARANLRKAQQTLMSYGIRQQRADPQGYMNALSAVNKMQADVALLSQGYEQLVTPKLGKMPTRM
jgi:hypothetical protein